MHFLMYILTCNETGDIVELHERFKTIREYLKCSQREMSKRMGISAQAWLDYEAEDPAKRKMPGAKVLIGLADKFGIDGNWLLLGKGKMLAIENETALDLDTTTLEAIIKIVEDECIKNEWFVSPEKKAKVIALYYKEFIEEVGDIEAPMLKKMLELAAVPIEDVKRLEKG